MRVGLPVFGMARVPPTRRAVVPAPLIVPPVHVLPAPARFRLPGSLIVPLDRLRLLIVNEASNVTVPPLLTVALFAVESGTSLEFQFAPELQLPVPIFQVITCADVGPAVSASTVISTVQQPRDWKDLTFMPGEQNGAGALCDLFASRAFVSRAGRADGQTAPWRTGVQSDLRAWFSWRDGEILVVNLGGAGNRPGLGRMGRGTCSAEAGHLTAARRKVARAEGPSMQAPDGGGDVWQDFGAGD